MLRILPNRINEFMHQKPERKNVAKGVKIPSSSPTTRDPLKERFRNIITIIITIIGN